MKNSALDIQAMLKRIVGMDAIPMSVLGIIVSVDEDEKTCVVKPIDEGTNYVDVLLMAESSTTGIYIKPSVDSLVMITPQNECTYFVSMFSDIDQILLRGNANGGLVKVSDLVTKLNNIENLLNIIIAWGLTVTPPLSGATPLIPTIANEIQSNTVKHG